MNANWIATARITLLISAALVSSMSAQQAVSPADLQAVIQKTFGPTKQVEVRDPFYNNMVAFTITIPKDWVFEGTVLHGPGCNGAYYQSIAYRAYSPDASIGVQQTPRLDYYYWEEKIARPDGPACKFFAPMSSADYAAMFADHSRPKPQIDKNEPVTDAQQVREYFEQGNQKIAQSARQLRIPAEYDTPDFTRTRLHYDWEGYQEEEWLRVEMIYRDYPKSVFIYNGGPHPGHQEWRHFLGVSTSLYSRRAPRGKLDQYDPALNAIIGSVQRTQEFIEATTNRQQQLSDMIIHSIQTQTMISQQNSQAFMNAMTQQHQNFMANQQKQFQISQQNATAQMDRRTQQAQNFTAQMNQSTAHTRDYQDILLDQQYYVNPRSGETSTVSGRFNHTFTNGPATSNATTVVQTDSNFNPNGAAGYNWTELMPTHH
jgi:hypothetical protein